MTSAAITAGSQSAFADAIDWINGLLLGSLAVGLCVIAVALVGMFMLSGRLPVRQGMRVILGCFILLGAPLIAAGLAGAWHSETSSPPPPLIAQEQRPQDPPPADFDPYAGASLRRD